MTGGKPKRPAETADQRRDRLAAELRANLAKRKAQARARSRAPVAGHGDAADSPGADSSEQ